MKTNLTKAFLAVALAPLFLASQARGALITWDDAATYVNPNTSSQVSLAGSLFTAASAYAQVIGTTYTVNTVAFGAFNSHITWTYDNQIVHPITPVGTDYQTMLTEGTYTFDSNSSTNAIVLTGLNPGQTYLVQVWTPYWDQMTFSTRYSSSAPNGPGFDHNAVESPTLQLGLSSNPTGFPPQFITGTFKADPSGTQNIYYFGDGTVGIISAIQVRAVPEPTTIGLLAVGALALVLRRRQQMAVR